MKRNFVVIYFLTAFLVVLVCNRESNISGEYVPGEIIVGLVDSVSYTTVVNFFSALNLEILELYIGYAFWVRADSGSLEYYQDLFSSDPNVDYVHQLTFHDDTLRMVIKCHGYIAVEEATEQISAVPHLHIYNVLTPPKFVLVKTEIGKELYWISRLERCEIVRYAELNYTGMWEAHGVNLHPIGIFEYCTRAGTAQQDRGNIRG